MNITNEILEPDTFYHIYNRGINSCKIFESEQNYLFFLEKFSKYMNGVIEVYAYCLMPNHFHLLLFQYSQDGVQKLMRRVMTGYAMYFNNRYDRVGSLFQGPYKASHITKDSYLLHISRYIHLNPEHYQAWPYSSLEYYRRTQAPPEWLHTDRILDLFSSQREYLEFVDEYHDSMRELALLKWQLANNPDDTDIP